MIYTLSNDNIQASFNSLGAELISVKDKEGCEYIWHADPKFWASHSPIMFPICGRLPNGKYTFEGKTYEMVHHGFARSSEFELAEKTDSKIVFALKANDKTRAIYPFEFELKITYTLNGNKLEMRGDIKNTDTKTLPASFGAHPGFNVPLDSGSFDDWYVEFDEDCTPDLIIFSENLLDSGKRSPYPLKDSRILPLSHSLFEIDGVFLTHIAKKATLKSDNSSRSITLTFPQMSYLGLWHAPRTEAPYVCIEPWCSIPSMEGMPDDIMQKQAMFHILPNKEKSVSLLMEFDR